MEIKLTYGLKEGKLLHISEVEKGLACDCFCPQCDSRLIARKGKMKQHHFAHYKSEDCNHAIESALHLMAKEVLQEVNSLTLPDLDYEERKPWNTYLHLLQEKFVFEYDKVTIEKNVGDFRPDLILHKGDEKLMVEIFVTHRIDEDKQKKIEQLKLNCIEIDLSAYYQDFLYDDPARFKTNLKELLQTGYHLIDWKYNALQSRYKRCLDYINRLQNIYSQVNAERRKHLHDVIERKTNLYHDQIGVSVKWYYSREANKDVPVIEDCPKNMRFYRGKPYASYRADCKFCEHHVENIYILKAKNKAICKIHPYISEEENSNARREGAF